VVTSHDRIDAEHPTGIWLSEFSEPYALFREAGYEVTVASIRGGKAPVDPRSLGETSGEDLTAALKELSDLQTVTGEITFKGTNGVPQKTVTIGGVENGEFVYRDAFVPAFIPEP